MKAGYAYNEYDPEYRGWMEAQADEPSEPDAPDMADMVMDDEDEMAVAA